MYKLINKLNIIILVIIIKLILCRVAILVLCTVDSKKILNYTHTLTNVKIITWCKVITFIYLKFYMR